MTTYLSSLLTSTTSRYNNLRRALLSDESDGDTEEDSHISRVLRAYYVEKGRPFPPWLGPDPSTPHSSSIYSQSAARLQTQTHSTRRPGGLSDLWDAPAQQSQPPQPTSLRRAGPASAARTASPTPPAAPQPNPDALGRFRTAEPSSARPPRPLPHGSRSMPGQQQPSYPPPPNLDQPRSSAVGPATSSALGGNTAQDRLKAKLWGAAKTTSSRGAG